MILLFSPAINLYEQFCLEKNQNSLVLQFSGCTEAMSPLQWPWVRLTPMALCCMSFTCTLSPFPVIFSAVQQSKGIKAPENIY